MSRRRPVSLGSPLTVPVAAPEEPSLVMDMVGAIFCMSGRGETYETYDEVMERTREEPRTPRTPRVVEDLANYEDECEELDECGETTTPALYASPISMPSRHHIPRKHHRRTFMLKSPRAAGKRLVKAFTGGKENKTLLID